MTSLQQLEPAREILAYDAPFPELAGAVQSSLDGLNSLMARLPTASQNFDAMIQWTAALRDWRYALYLAHGYLTSAGFDVPCWDLELEAAPTLFLITWRDYLAKVLPLVEPLRVGAYYVVQ